MLRGISVSLWSAPAEPAPREATAPLRGTAERDELIAKAFDRRGTRIACRACGEPARTRRAALNLVDQGGESD